MNTEDWLRGARMASEESAGTGTRVELVIEDDGTVYFTGKNGSAEKAKAIVEYRKKQGGFKSIDELENVEGIGSKTLSNLRKDLSLTGKTTAVVDTKSVGNVKAGTSGSPADSKTAKPATKEPVKK
jgi:competence ComEA-like helix-hairpin-helix protein